MSADKPKIACLPNGPYYLINDTEPQVVPHLHDADGNACATVSGVALCRCGGSQNKPFCDGTHGRIGFSDENLADPARDKVDSYTGTKITIHDNRSICAHAGFCTDKLASVFRMGEEPWIDANGASVDDIIAAVDRCPSGALSYTIAGSDTAADASGPPAVKVAQDGPYVVTGGIEILGQPLAAGASGNKVTLCRCGGSKNKPFCDGTHWHIGFKDDANR